MSTAEDRRRYFRAPWGWTLWILTGAAGGGVAIGFAVSGVLRGSIRTFGNGGLFGFVGHFRNDALGPDRAYATKRDHAVVLRLADGPAVVTPDEPYAFVEAMIAERALQR